MSRNNISTIASNNGNAVLSGSSQTNTNSKYSEQNAKSNDWFGEGVEIFYTFQTGLFLFGKERAVSSGAVEPDEEAKKSLEEHARAMAEETFRQVFDPAGNVHDRLRDEFFRQTQKELGEARLAEKHIEAELGLREEEAAKVKTKVPQEPPFPAFTALFGVGVIALTTAPTLHDNLFLPMGGIWAWTLSLLAGLVWGVFIVYSILDGGSDDDNQTLKNQLGLISGVGMALALGLIRLMSANTTSDYVVALGFTILEIAIVIGLEGVAHERRRQQREFSEKAIIAGEATELVKALQTRLERKQRQAKELAEKVQRHLNYVAERHLRFVQKDQLIAAAVKAILDGYNAGITENRGKILGLKK